MGDVKKLTDEEKALQKSKAKYWTAVLYPENMIPDWEEKIGEILQYAFCYCKHDKDLLKETEEEQRKEHVHLVLAFNNTTTYRNAFNLILKLSADGKRACNKIEAVNNVRYMYEYLIHNTEKAKKDGKFQYDRKERICGNNFDIGSYEQLSVQDKLNMIKELVKLIKEQRITNYFDFVELVMAEFDDGYFELISTKTSFFKELCRGLYLKEYNEKAYGITINKDEE